MVGLACPHKPARPLWIHWTSYEGGYVRNGSKASCNPTVLCLLFRADRDAKHAEELANSRTTPLCLSDADFP